LFSVFGDESHDEGKKRVFAVAGVFGTQKEWDDIGAKWLARTGGTIFHAAECESDAGDFAAVPHTDNLKLYADLTKLIAESPLNGYGVAVDLISQNEVFPPSDLPDDVSYYKCFAEVLLHFAEQTFHKDSNEIAEFTFDRRLETQHNATVLYDYMAIMPEWRFHPYIKGEVGFASRKVIGIQIADLVVRETMKDLDNQIGPKKRDTRRSFLALEETGCFEFKVYDKSHFEALRKTIDDMESVAGAFSQRGYREWLTQQNIMDNYSSRVRYLTYFEAMERQKGIKPLSPDEGV
jgi:hypothetical protein